MPVSWVVIGFLLFSSVPQIRSFKLPFGLPFPKFAPKIPAAAHTPNVGLVSNDPNKIRFLLYSDSGNPSKFEVLEHRKIDTVRRSRYDPSKPTKFLVHGFQNDFSTLFPQNVKNAYLKKRSEYPWNIIVVDWGLLAAPNVPVIAPILYPFAVKNVWTTGIRLGEFISWLKNENLIDLNKVHIIGFSLGSHVAGKAGDWLQKNHGQPVRRITDDGQYVDAIHTNAGQLGTWNNVGQADFFVNGGSGPQPGCLQFGSVKNWFHSIKGVCSHEMSTKFFAKTILDDARKAKDSKQVVFGENSPSDTRGRHFIKYEM